MTNTVNVGFSNNGTSAHYVVDNENLAGELGVASVLGAASITDNVTGGALSDPYVVPPEGFTGPEAGIVNAAYAAFPVVIDEAYLFAAEGWNKVKNITVEAEGDCSILFIADNFVHADMDFSGVTNSVMLLVFDGKRGNYLTGDGNDLITITTATNNEGWSNLHTMKTGSGNDVVLVARGEAGLIDSTIVNFVDGRFTTVEADLGQGNDVFASGPGVSTMDNVKGGAGNDSIFTSKGDDIIEGGTDDGAIFQEDDELFDLLARGDILGGGEGADKFVYATGDGFDHIIDFEDEDILEMLTGDGDTVATQAATLQTDNGDLSGTMVLVNGEAAVFLQDFTNEAEIFV